MLTTLTALLVAAAALLGPPAPADAPARSGTILAPVRPSNGLGPMPGCRYTPDCLAAITACAPSPAPEAGVSSSFIDVAELAGLPEQRRFELVERLHVGAYGGVTIEMWDDRCGAVPGDSRAMTNVKTTAFAIPARTKWMSVVPGCYWICYAAGSPALRWELR